MQYLLAKQHIKKRFPSNGVLEMGYGPLARHYIFARDYIYNMMSLLHDIIAIGVSLRPPAI